MPIIIPIKELKNTASISEKCNNSNEPIFITKNGYGDMVIMSIKLYEETIGQLMVAKSIKESLEDPRESIPVNQAMETLRETEYLSSMDGVKESIIKGLNTPLEDCEKFSWND